MIGRRAALDRMVGLMADPPSDVVLVVGEAGIGKSALVSTALRSLGDDVRRVVVQTPLVPERRFAVWSAAATSLGIDLPDTDATVSSAEQVAELVGVLGGAIAGHGPTVVVVEDVHRADPWSIEVLGWLPALVGPQVAFVATTRPVAEVDGPRNALEASSNQVRLGPLENDDIVAVIESLTGHRPNPEEAAHVVAASGGNPLLIRELAQDPHRAHRSAAAGTVLESLLDRLVAPVREAVELLALAGPGTPDAVIASALQCERDDLEERWQSAIGADVLVAAATGVGFRHDLLAETAASVAGVERRRFLHGRLAIAWAEAPRPDELRRVRHLMWATAPDAGADIVDEVRRCAADLAVVRRHADAADLLDDVLARWGDDLSARDGGLVAADLGDVLLRAGFVDRAVTAYQRAAEFARSSGDLELRARAEVGRQRRRNPFIPDPEGRATLAAIDAEMATSVGDSSLRVTVLGRRAALAVQPPPDSREAMRLAEEGVAMARRLQDPVALLGALEEWGLVVGDREDIDRLGTAADELASLAVRTERRDMLLTAYEWRFADRLRRGDLGGAEGTVREVEALAAVSPSPLWQLTALQRRMLVHAYRGDRSTARALVGSIGELGAQFLGPFESRAIQMGPRASMSIVYGSVDPDVIDLQSGFVGDFDTVPAPFIQIAIAALQVVLGDDAAGLRRAEGWLNDPGVARDSPNPPTTFALLALLARRRGDPAVAAGVHRELAPYAGALASLFDHGIELPVEYHLAGLDLVIGEVERTVENAQSAVRFALSMGSPVLEAVCLARLAEAWRHQGNHDLAGATYANAEGVAERVGVVLDPPWSRPAERLPAPRRAADALSTGPSPVTAELIRGVDGWQIDISGVIRSLPNITGMSMLARLVEAPGIDVGADELAGRHRADAAPVESDLGPVLDARAKREYRQRIAELQQDELDAGADNDLERAARARIELDLLIDELQRATGLGGRDRPQRSSNEKDRINVTRNLGRAIKAIESAHRGIGGHLRTAIRTGHRCVYEPDPTTAVVLRVADRR